MKKILLFNILFALFILAGCSTENNFLKPGTGSSSDTFNNIIKSFSGDYSGLNIDANLSGNGSRNTVKGYAQQYYNDEMSGYVNTAKNQVSGAVDQLKNQYNSGIDAVTKKITDDVNQKISNQMNNLKAK